MKSTEREPLEVEGHPEPDRVFEARDLAMGGLLGALAIALPMVFHALGPGVGPIFLPMYLPLLALGLLSGWQVALTAGCIVPLLSAVLTGMPPLAPPIALLMLVELAALATTASVARSHRLGILPATVLALVAARVAGVLALLTVGHALGYNKSVFEYAILGLAVSWPGMLLQLTIVPGAVAIIERTSLLRPRWELSTHD